MSVLRALIFSVFLVVSSFPALADEAPVVSPAEPVDDITSAKDLNRKGLVLLDAGDYAGALSFFESSRALVRSYANTRNAAVCLDALGRKREALVMLESLLSDYADILNADERAIAEKRVAELRKEFAPIPPPPPPPPVSIPAAPVVSIAPRSEKRRPPSQWSIGAYVGYTTGSSLGSDAEASVAQNCTTNCPAMSGTIAGLRVEYRMARFLTLEVSGGYLRVDSAFTQSWKYSDFTYTVDFDRSLSGGFADLGVSSRLPFGDRVGLLGRFAVGGFFADVTNTNTGFSTGKGSQQGDLSVSGGKPSIEGRSLYFRPELGLEVTAQPFVLGVGVGAIVSTSSGPTFGELRLSTERNACWAPTLGACAPDLDVSTGHRGYGVFVAFVPQIGVRFQFD